MHTNGALTKRARKIKARLALKGWSVNDLVSHLPVRSWRGTERRPSRNAVSRAINQNACPDVLKLINQTLGL